MSDETPSTLPFHVVVSPSPRANLDSASSPASGDASGHQPDEGDFDAQEWSLDDIEAAYQQALESLDDLDATVAEAAGVPDVTPPDAHPDTSSELTPDGDPMSGTIPPQPAGLAAFFPSAPQEAPPLAVLPRQVVEALLFVGGMTLPSRKIADVIGGSTSPEDVLCWIDELNSQYDVEGRPYRIELTEGGHRLQLRSEFEKIRHRAYGFGPREVKLSQDVLEILSFIAYSQPVSSGELDALGRTTTASVVRQLLRRELVEMVRTDQGELTYKTTPRFLEVFGLRSLHDLPLPGDLAFK